MDLRKKVETFFFSKAKVKKNARIDGVQANGSLNEVQRIINQLDEVYLYAREPNRKRIEASDALGAVLRGAKRGHVDLCIQLLLKKIDSKGTDIQNRRKAVRGVGLVYNLLNADEKEVFRDHFLDSLLPALNEESDDLVADCAWALGELGDERAIQPLIEVLGKGDQEFWRDRRFSDRPEDNLVADNAYRKTHQYAAWALGKIDDHRGLFYELLYFTLFVPVSEKPQDTYDYKYKNRIKRAAGLNNALDLALEASSHVSIIIREGAFNVLGQLECPDAEEAVLKALNDDCIRVQKAAIRAASMIGLETAVEPLFELLFKPLAFSIYEEIFAVLEKIDSYDLDKVGNRILELLMRDNVYMLKRVLPIVGKVKFEIAAEPLIELGELSPAKS